MSYNQQDGNLFFTEIHDSFSKDFKPVPLHRLANYSSLKKKQTNAEFHEAYSAALQVVLPLAGLPVEQQLVGVAKRLRGIFDAGGQYSSSVPHYNDPYGFFIKKIASCAGATRATGLCLNILGIPYEHVNENKWSHQWCRVNLHGKYWICDPFVMFVGEERVPYKHPRVN